MKQDADQIGASGYESVAFIGNYVPRHCGIATFTRDLLESVTAARPEPDCFAVSITDGDSSYRYPEAVRFQIAEQDRSSYHQAAEYLNLIGADLVCLQHEYGIFGGPDGAYILETIANLRMPVVTTMHTIVQNPTAGLRETTLRLTELSQRIVVMADRGREILENVYGVDPAKVDIVPHGIPDVPFVDPHYHKQDIGTEGRLMLLTFGLLSPGKGIENAIAALPEIVAKHPEVIYVILGATHPNLLRTEGEAYRDSLHELARSPGVADHVRFHDHFVSNAELERFIGAADIYVTPYLNEAQITSGTLAYAVGAGKAVVSTPYWHACELLADDRGKLVEFANPDALSKTLCALIEDKTGRHAMRRAAYEMGREMTWPRVAARYVSIFDRVCQITETIEPAATRGEGLSHSRPPAIDLRHVCRMTDSTGIWQHAHYNVPRFEDGYCTDDNARALMLAVLLEQTGEAPAETLSQLATANLAFIDASFDHKLGRFRNFLSFDRQWIDGGAGSEDSHGRALWGLGHCAGKSKSSGFRTIAANLFLAALPAVEHFSSPRAWAFALLGIAPYLEHFPGDVFVESVRDRLADHLLRLYDASNDPDWRWFESCLAYANARLPEALLVTGHAAEKPEIVALALDSLTWLMGEQTGETSCFSPIGSEDVYRRGGRRHHFDQQPIEAHASVSACLAAWRITGEEKWYQEARRALAWFLGANDVGLPLYDASTGGCRDGLHIDRVNENLGAESTLAFQLSLAELHLAETNMKSGSPALAVSTAQYATSTD